MEDRNYIRQCGVCMALIALNCLISFPGFFLDEMFCSFALIPEKVIEGEYYRLITCMFLHGDFTHLAGNMVGIFCMGQLLEMRVGHMRTLLTYLATGVFASLFVTMTSSDPAAVIRIGHEAISLNCAPYEMTIGASGAVFGLLAAVLFRMIRTGDMTKIKGLLINLAINLYTTFTVPGISVAGHVGGMAAGFVLGMVLREKRECKICGEP